VATILAASSVLTAGPSQANDGEAAFKARCGDCHGPRDVARWGRERADAAARQAWLDQFLRRHHRPSDAERALIISYIQATISGPATRR
jgi:mono/diheme cytochrome c family protein